MKRSILVATSNPGKLAELSQMLDADVEWLSLKDFPRLNEVIEDGLTFEENARKKALGYAEQTGLWTIADDSGLAVDILDGEPGIHSARFSGEKSPETDRTLHDHKNMAKLLELLKDTPQQKRTARFVCAICLASPGKILAETKGYLEGKIANETKGENGFGYDPIFYISGKNKTVAELTSDKKNQISHRANAVKKLKPLLNNLLNSTNTG